MEIYVKIFGLSLFEETVYSRESDRLLAFHINRARPVLKITSNMRCLLENSPPDIARISIFLCQVEPVLTSTPRSWSKKVESNLRKHIDKNYLMVPCEKSKHENAGRTQLIPRQLIR